MSVRIGLSAFIYPRDCLQQAISAYSTVCLIDIINESSSGCVIEINPTLDNPDPERLSHEFLNYLLDLSVEQYVKHQTARLG